MPNLNPHFRCPHCNSVQPKSEIDQMMSGSSFVSGASFSPAVTCSSCGGSIERLSVIQGKYDLKGRRLGQTIKLGGAILVIGLLIWLLSWLFSQGT
jgi:hypothetical protein